MHGYQLTTVAVIHAFGHSYRGLYMVMGGYSWLCMVIEGYGWLWAAIHGYRALYMVMVERVMGGYTGL